MNGNDAMAKIADHLLGKRWYIADPVSGDQANEIILEEIMKKYESADVIYERERKFQERLHLFFSRAGWMALGGIIAAILMLYHNLW